MIDDFADRALILRNRANISDEPSQVHAFNAELAKHGALTELRRKLPEAKGACIALGQNSPADQAGV
ncbi:hypothetical protein IB262_30540 [Ensifer sp. ENS02]|uniref:hypothetical protein n=1 Tax=Ensifer sp. ENS02 TaxID=2769290 RepID=UPI001782E752|nr:hypothetical protein [Ensifer sp. ENS02]MBD9524229.1 hypothetical protein [Ensifer sp. ENS02]